MRAERVVLAEETLEGYGMRQRAVCRVTRPESVAGIAAVFAEAAASGESVGLRGAGCSYGDAALNGGQVVLDTSRMTRVLAWDPATGEMTAEPGVTIAQVWRHTLADGWWPPVVPGTMAVTLGGAAAGNIHGKNQWRDGSFGDHVLRFEMVLPSGQQVTCSREEHPDLFHAAIGGMGLLGCFTAITLRMRRIYSGMLHVRQTAHSSLAHLLAALDEGTQTATHMVAWMDMAARGPGLGRGLLKAMRELAPGEDPNPAWSLNPAVQPPSGRIAGVLPAEWVPTLGKPMATPLGIRFVNRAQWVRGNLPGADRDHLERYVPANFMLNFIPNFKRIYLPGGLIQHQSFVPRAAAERTFRAILERSQAAGLAPSLAVLKKHKPGNFLLNYLGDSYSLALDFAVPRGTERATLALMGELNALVVGNGGSFFLPKDSTLTPADFSQAYAVEALARLRDLKRTYDPGELLQTDIYRRVMRPAWGAPAGPALA
ncbi:MAG TPA: FAD-binding oxidoreductase [Ktedonobacterales bacterium]|nr:FAD-binding oxidoreductase [Ktedonobacterales bacterium]